MLSIDSLLALRTRPDYLARLAAFVARARRWALVNGLDANEAERTARHWADTHLAFGRMPRTDAEVAAAPRAGNVVIRSRAGRTVRVWADDAGKIHATHTADAPARLAA